MLVEDFIITVDNDITITVPKGYVTDGSSIPRIFHRLYHPFVTEAIWASCVHDYMYSHLYTRFSKDFADELFKEMIKKDGGSVIMQQAFYRSVRLNRCGGGW
jgi:hypothetical protein